MFRLVALTSHLSGKHRCHFLLAGFSHKTRGRHYDRGFVERLFVSACSLYCVQLLAHLSECLPFVETRRKREDVSLLRPYGT